MNYILSTASSLFMVGLLVVPTVSVHACSVLNDPNRSQFISDWEADNNEMFVGTVSSIESQEEEGCDIVTFDVNQILKGSTEATKTVLVQTQQPEVPITSCGPLVNIYEPDTTYIVSPRIDDQGRLTESTLEFTLINTRTLEDVKNVDRRYFQSQGIELISATDTTSTEDSPETDPGDEASIDTAFTKEEKTDYAHDIFQVSIITFVGGLTLGIIIGLLIDQLRKSWKTTDNTSSNKDNT